MSKVVELIDEAKHQCGIESDYALADAIDVGRQAISDARKGRFVPGPYILLRLAKMANRDIGQVIAEIEAERETRPKRLEWLRHHMHTALMVAIVVTSVMTMPEKANAASMTYEANNSQTTNYRVFCFVVLCMDVLKCRYRFQRRDCRGF